MKKIISIENAPKAIGPYSQGIVTDNLVFLSGQIAIDPLTNKLVESDIKVQTKQVLENIKNLLLSQNLTFDNIVKSTVFITDLSNFIEVNKIYAEYFTSVPPARSCVEVSKLPMNSLIEIEIIATKN